MKLAKSYSKATILKTFEENGKMYAHIEEKCDRCGGSGIFFVAVHNGHGVPAQPDNGMCYKCGGLGKLRLTVRAYSDEEFERMQGYKKNQKERQQKEWEAKVAQRIKEQNVKTLQRHGFEGPEAYAVIGNTYNLIDDLKKAGARYSPQLKWILSTDNRDFDTRKISVDDVFETNQYGVMSIKESAADFIENLTEPVGNYLGTPGQKLTVQANLNRIVSYDTKFGITYMHVFETADRDTLIWKTTSCVLEPGTNYNIVGKVKEHDTYNRTKQTILTHCKVEVIS